MDHNNEVLKQEEIDKISAHASNLLANENKSPAEVKAALMESGLDENNSSTIVENLVLNQPQSELLNESQDKAFKEMLNEFNGESNNDAAKKDMLYGALWCVGGTILTIAEIGYVFWGAIIFGGYQFLKGAFSLKSKG